VSVDLLCEASSARDMALACSREPLYPFLPSFFAAAGFIHPTAGTNVIDEWARSRVVDGPLPSRLSVENTPSAPSQLS